MNFIQLFLIVFSLAFSFFPTAISAQQSADHLKLEFIKIPQGCFWMGRNIDFERGSNDEVPQHEVCFDKDIMMGKTEVNQAQWVSVMGDNPSKFKGQSLPVERVSWNDVQQFIKKSNLKAGKELYRLPSEAEWEYAARAGSTTTYSFGDDPADLDKYTWHWDNSDKRTHPVGSKLPNQWGLHDMHGNVWEWVQDWYHGVSYSQKKDKNQQSSEKGRLRVRRGGGWFSDPESLRSANRDARLPDSRYRVLGFRLVKMP